MIRAPLVDVGVDPDQATMRLDEGLGDGQAQAGPATTAVLAEHLEDALAVLPCNAGTVVGDSDLHQLRVAGRAARRHTDHAVVGGEALGVLEHVRQDLAHQDGIEVEGRQVCRRLDRDAAGGDDPAQLGQRLVDQVGEADRHRSELERACLQPGHVEKVGHQPRQAVRLQLNELQQLGAVLRTQLGIDLAHARDGRFDGGQRGAQVVRGRAHQRPAPTVDLLEQARPQGLLAELRPVDGQRGLVGERAEEAAVVLHQLHVLEHQHAHGPVVDDQRDRDSARAGIVEPSEGSRLTAARRDRSDVLVRQGLARAGGNPQGRRSSMIGGIRIGQHQRRPARSEDRLHGGHDVRQQLRQREVADQGLGQLVQAFGLLGPAFRLLPGALQLGHDLGDDQDDHDVDDKRDPVLRRADRQRVVGREEEHVVEDESPQCADEPGNEATDDGPGQRRQHEQQRREGDAQVGPEGKQEGQQRAEADQRDGDPQRGSLVRCPGKQPSWSDLRHNFPSFGASLSVPTPWWDRTKRGGNDCQHG